MNPRLIRLIFERTRNNQTFEIRDANVEPARWLCSLGASEEIAEHFEKCSLTSDARIDELKFLGAASIRKTNEEYPQIIAAGFLVMGFLSNGDFLVIDMKSSAVGFISHELIAEGCSREDFRVHSESLEEFLMEAEQIITERQRGSH